MPLGLCNWPDYNVQSHPVWSLINISVQCNQLHLLLRDQLEFSNTTQIGTDSYTCLGQLIERDRHIVGKHHDFCIHSIRWNPALYWPRPPRSSRWYCKVQKSGTSFFSRIAWNTVGVGWKSSVDFYLLWDLKNIRKIWLQGQGTQPLTILFGMHCKIKVRPFCFLIFYKTVWIKTEIIKIKMFDTWMRWTAALHPSKLHVKMQPV